MQRLAALAAAAALALPLACGGDSAAPDTTVASLTLTGPSGAASLSFNAAAQTAQVTAAAKNAAGSAVSATLTWSSDSAAVVTVDQAGLVTAVGAGTTTVHAKAAGASATIDGTISATVTLTAAGPVATVTVAPATLVIAAGNTGSFSATGKDAGGVTVSSATFTWSSADTTHAAVSSTGKVSASLGVADFGVGPIAITATSSNGKTGTAQASVAVVSSWSFASGAAGDTVDVKQNQYVVFNNPDGSTQHSVVLDSPVTTVAPAFTNDSAPAQVTLAPGSYPFHCGIHGNTMKGTLVVH